MMKREERKDFSVGVISIRDIIEVSNAVLSVVEGLPHHRRMGVNMDLYHHMHAPRLLC